MTELSGDVWYQPHHHFLNDGGEKKKLSLLCCSIFRLRLVAGEASKRHGRTFIHGAYKNVTLFIYYYEDFYSPKTFKTITKI